VRSSPRSEFEVLAYAVMMKFRPLVVDRVLNPLITASARWFCVSATTDWNL